MTTNDVKFTISDKIKEYLVPLNGQILFDELADGYLRKAGIYDILHGVPVPIRVDAEQGLTTLTIALGMAAVLGADPEFRYREAYLAYIRKLFGNGFTRILLSEGAKAGGEGRFEEACVWFRAALLLEPLQRDALYLYGRACKDAYEQEGRPEDYVGNFKAQSIELFEVLTMAHPDDAIGYYFLGYSYANLGLYVKAKLTWEDFLRLSEREEEASAEETPVAGQLAAIPAEEMQNMREEVRERLRRLEDPVVIENGINHILSGDYQGGRAILEPYTEGPYQQWWPLWYYLGIAAASLGDTDEASADLRQALRLSPSNIEVMRELVEISRAAGDLVTAEKYESKIRVVQQSMLAEQED